MKRTYAIIGILLTITLSCVSVVSAYSESYYSDMSSINTKFTECLKNAGSDSSAQFVCKSALIKEKVDIEYKECAKDYPNEGSIGNDNCKKTQAQAIEQQQSELTENQCKQEYGRTCAEEAAKNRNVSGQGFKLPLDFLTLKTKDSNGKEVVQGKSIFASTDYPVEKYGVLLGTFLRIIDILIYIIGSVALLTLIVAGIMMIANHGDEGWVTKGKGMMLYSILGVIFALLSFIFVNIITSLLA